MKAFTKSFRLSRNVSVFISFILLMAIFFASFYFHYIPSNKEQLNNYAFIILNDIRNNIEERYEDLKIVIQTNNDNLKGSTVVKESQVTLKDISRKYFIYEYPEGKQKTQDSLEHNLASVYKTYKEELFDGLMLMKYCDGNLCVVSNSLFIDAGNTISADSLLKDKKGLFIPGTRQITIGDIDYMMFYVPFTIDKQNLLMLGFIKTSTYNSKLHEISPSVIYIFVILLLLLLIALPVMKFFFMNSREELKFSDLFLFVFSLLVGSTLITLMLIQFMILLSTEIRAQANLDTLSLKIRTAFLEELDKAYMKLSSLDDSVCKNKSLVTTFKNTNYKQASISTNRNDTSQFLSFDRFAWTNDSGQQFIKSVNDTVYPFVKDRKYFKAFENNEPYEVPGHPGSSFGMEALYNRINGQFRTVISKRSNYQGAFIVSLSCNLRSVTQTILPAGYKFCIIDEEGTVQYHSDSARNLRENFFRYFEDPDVIKRVINSRQTESTSGVLYGRTQCINICPVKGLPLYLVTFYDESHITSMNMRILIFALTCCFVSFVIYFIIWYFSLWQPYIGLGAIQTTLRSCHWIIPKPTKLPVYHFCIWVLLSYALALILLTLGAEVQNISTNYLMLLIMFATPIILGIIASIFLKKPKEGKSSKRSSNAINEIKNAEKKYLRSYSWVAILVIIVLDILPACIFTWYSHNQELIQVVKKHQLFIASKIIERRSLLEKTLLKKKDYGLEYYDQVCYQQGVYGIYSDIIKTVDTIPIEKLNKSFDSFYFDISNNISKKFNQADIYPALEDEAQDNTWRWHIYPKDSIVLYHAVSANDTLNKNITTYLRVKSVQPPRYVFVTFDLRGFALFIIAIISLVGTYFIINGMAAKVFLKKFMLAYKDQRNVYAKYYIDKYIYTVPNGNNKKEQLLDLANNFIPVIKNNDITVVAEKEQQILDEMEKNLSFYEYVWKQCKENEKHLLYNFAKDGMLNFKNTTVIHSLFRKGSLIVNDNYEVCLFSGSFRLYMLHYLPASESEQLQQKSNEYSTWDSFKTLLLVVLAAIACFIFFTQEQTWQKIVAFITAFGSSLPLLLNIFSKTVSAKK